MNTQESLVGHVNDENPILRSDDPGGEEKDQRNAGEPAIRHLRFATIFWRSSRICR